MKKLLLTILFITLAVSVVFATDIRSMGIGGDHVADNADIYTLLRNPAGLGSTGKHLLLPLSPTINIGGPLEDAYNFLDKNVINPAPDANGEISKEIIDLVQKNNGIDVNLDVNMPIFAFTNGGFGFGIFTDINAALSVPSISSAKVNAQAAASAVLGYGKRIKLPIGALSLGFSAKGAVVVPRLKIQSTVVGLMNNIDSLVENLPSSNIYSYTINGGAQFDLWNFITIGATWNNILSGTYEYQNAKLEDAIAFDMSGTPINGKYTQTVGVGAKVSLPTFFTFGLINFWEVYLDHENVLDLLPQKTLVRNPILGFGAGTELQLLRFLTLRAGLKDSYLTAGVGIKLGMLNLEAAAYGKELGLEPGARPQMNVAVSISLKK